MESHSETEKELSEQELKVLYEFWKFYNKVIKKYQVVVITNEDDPDFMELEFRPRNKRGKK